MPMRATRAAEQSVCGSERRRIFGRLADRDVAGARLVDIGQHPDGLGRDQGEQRLAGGEHRAELLGARDHDGVERRLELVLAEHHLVGLVLRRRVVALGAGGFDLALRDQKVGPCDRLVGLGVVGGLLRGRLALEQRLAAPIDLRALLEQRLGLLGRRLGDLDGRLRRWRRCARGSWRAGSAARWRRSAPAPGRS